MKKSAIALTTALLMIGSTYAAEPTNNPVSKTGQNLIGGPTVVAGAIGAMVVATTLNDNEENSGNSTSNTGTGTTTTSTGTGTGTTTTSVTN
ncbi:hypothetical protein [Shewanella sp.]|uniref:hypothetical protein n=1 Tax=Shewanella sp. TaxID=50422 RepID=UPI0040474446